MPSIQVGKRILLASPPPSASQRTHSFRIKTFRVHSCISSPWIWCWLEQKVGTDKQDGAVFGLHGLMALSSVAG